MEQEKCFQKTEGKESRFFQERESVLKVYLKDARAQLPQRAHSLDAGLDLRTLEDVTLHPGKGVMVSTGLCVSIPQGMVGLICDRSSLGKQGIKTLGGVIDSGYHGEVKVLLWNLSKELKHFRAQSKIAQLIVFPIQVLQPVSVASLEQTDRGEGGFGSTGVF